METFSLLSRCLVAAFLLLSFGAAAQQKVDSTIIDNRIRFAGDFRFRFEEDWNSRKSDGSLRTDRFRMRYRFRYGMKKQLDRYFTVGGRVRTGNLNDQQGPHLTLGGDGGEFSTLSLGLEKAYLRFENECLWAWIGKNDYPFWKAHELLWNDNVFPEGLAVGSTWKLGKQLSVSPTSGYFVLRPGNDPIRDNSYLFSNQVTMEVSLSDKAKLTANIGDLYFRNMPNIPDGQHDMLFDYNIMSASVQYKRNDFTAGVDYYVNTLDYRSNPEINGDMADERTGQVIYFTYGRNRKKGDLFAGIYLARIGKYSIVDYLAQNDWARWDYSGNGATGARLSNFRGYEFRAAYQLTDAVNAVARLYQVEELVTAATPETGQRFRIDINAKF